MRVIRSAVLTGATALTLVVPAAAQAEPNSGTPTARVDHYTALAVSVQYPPLPVVASDGHQHLAYELLMLNWTDFNSTVERIEVLDGDRVVADFRDATLDAVVSSISQAPGRTIGAGLTYKAVLDVVLPVTARPRTLVHRFTVTSETPPGLLQSPFLAARTTVATEWPVVLEPPVRGPGWVNLTGCCTPEAHRLILQGLNGGLFLGQRFAIDTAQLTPDRRVFNGPPDQVTSYPGYGTPILAGAPGRVVVAVDRWPNQIPFAETEPTSVESISGNHVIIDIGGGRYLYYAHLQPGSVQVAVGDRVRAGRPLGRLGNSGFSTLPHVHFQVMDAPSPLASEGLPFVIRSFDSPGSVPPLDQIDLTAPIPIGPELAGHHERVTPMIRQVVDYPAG